MVKVTCVHCNNEFEVRSYRKDTAKFCSRKCKDDSLKGKPTWNKIEWPILKCEHCEKDYSVPPNQANRSRFCSRLCQNRWISANKKRTGPNNPMYRTGNSPRHYRREAFRIHGEKCNRCGELNYNKLLVHHIDENRNNNSLDGSNWEILCKRCHQLHHRCEINLPDDPRPKTLYKNICPTCKTSFDTTNKNKKFCRKKCWIESKKTKVFILKHCAYCNKSFSTDRHEKLFCGRTCSNKSRASS